MKLCVVEHVYNSIVLNLILVAIQHTQRSCNLCQSCKWLIRAYSYDAIYIFGAKVCNRKLSTGMRNFSKSNESYKLMKID